jgi:hypothetical protein
MAETNGATQIVCFTLLPRAAWTDGSSQAMSWTNLNSMITNFVASKTNYLLVPWNTMFTTNDLSDGTHLYAYGQTITGDFIATNLMPMTAGFQCSANYLEVRR